MNLFQYVGNNSINLEDPLGLYYPAPAGPPPVGIPNNTDPNNTWEPVNNPNYNPNDPLSRPTKWKPKKPVKNPNGTGGQPSGSWDPKYGHWDVKNGDGTTDRYDKDGNPLDPTKAHKFPDTSPNPKAPPNFNMCPLQGGGRMHWPNIPPNLINLPWWILPILPWLIFA